MNKHKLQAIALLSAVLCFFVISVSLSRSTYAYVFGQSHICRSDFYTEKTESSVPESSVPESSYPESSVPESSTTTKTGDGTNTLPIAALMFFSVIAITSLSAALTRSKKHSDTDDR